MQSVHVHVHVHALHIIVVDVHAVHVLSAITINLVEVPPHWRLPWIYDLPQSSPAFHWSHLSRRHPHPHPHILNPPPQHGQALSALFRLLGTRTAWHEAAEEDSPTPNQSRIIQIFQIGWACSGRGGVPHRVPFYVFWGAYGYWFIC